MKLVPRHHLNLNINSHMQQLFKCFSFPFSYRYCLRYFHTAVFIPHTTDIQYFKINASFRQSISINRIDVYKRQQFDCVFTDIRPDAVKIGMVSQPELIAVIVELSLIHI